jgi:hypothetical protein
MEALAFWATTRAYCRRAFSAALRFRNIANRLRQDAADEGRPLPREDGSCPLLDWIEQLPVKVQAKCFLRVERLRELGHELRRPEADLLRDGIYELRASLQGVHYRILYFFHGAIAAVVAHGIVKEGAVPAKHRQEESTR